MKKFHIVMIALLFMISCKSEKTKLMDRIKINEAELLIDTAFADNRKKAEEVVALYKEYADKFKEDTASAEYLFRAADLLNGIGDYKAAIKLYAQCSANNNFKKQPIALFLQGFIYENNLGDMINAKRIYEEFILKYADNKLAEDAKFSLDNLGKTPDDLFKMFEKNDSLTISADSATSAK